MNAAVFLDRDNTLIHNDGDLGDPAQVKLIQGAASAIASLRGLGYKVVVITNQGGVARGKFTERDVEAVHNRINEMVKNTSGTAIDRFYYCPYHPEGQVEKYRREHPWRKPQPGMLIEAARDLDLDLGQSWMIGDQMRDVEAGAAAGVRTILLRPDAEELTPLRLEQIAKMQNERGATGGPVGPSFSARNLIEAVRIVAQQRKPESPEEMRLREKTARKWDAGSPRPAASAPTAAPTVAPADTPRVAGESEAGGTPAVQGSPKPRPSPSLHRPLPARPVRPYKPWDAPPLDPAASQPASAPPPAAAPQEPVLPYTPETPTLPPTTANISVPPVADLDPDAAAPEALPLTGPERATSVDSDDPQSSSVEQSLRQILQELRYQRDVRGEFSFVFILVILLQVIAVVLLLGGILMGQHDMSVFVRWVATAIFFQLAAISAALSGKK